MTSEAKRLVDVSVHNGVINWPKFAESGMGAIIRCGYGDDIASQDDRRFVPNVEGCIRNNVPFGVYLYSYAKTPEQVESEINHALRLVAPYKDAISYPVFWDSEEKGTQHMANQGAKMWCESLLKAGYQPGVYASLSWWKSYIPTNYANCWRWVAAWHAENLGQEGCDLWQYTNQGSAPGINGNVDMNVNYSLPIVGALNKPSMDSSFFDTLAVACINGAYGNSEEREKKLGVYYYDTQARINQYYRVAKQVIRGDYGNGAERIERLQALGYNPQAVQKIVNDLLA